MSLRKGQVVTIYVDPITMKSPEGKARLKKFISMIDSGVELWDVRFVEDGYETSRIIKDTTE